MDRSVFSKSNALLAFCCVFAVAGVAKAATVIAGPNWWGDVITPNGCVGGYLQAKLQNGGTVYNYGYAYAKQCTNVNPQPVVLPAGWIGRLYSGYRNGGYCGSVGWTYSSVATDAVFGGSSICSNPSGSQSFQTAVTGQIWNGNSYTSFGTQWSPSLND
jgi:hypothetical protein